MPKEKPNTNMPALTGWKTNRFLVFLPVFILLSMTTAAQNIFGVVNTYYRVIEVIPSKSCIRVTSTAGLGFNDRVMIVQMKGASMNTSDVTSSTFGDTTFAGLGVAGNYEMSTVCYTVGDSVFLIFELLNNYSAADKVQLVRVPQYTNVTVTDTLKAAPWNNTTGTGGVLAIFVAGTLTLNAPISVDTMGYRGGAFKLSNSSCNNSPGANLYAYNANTLNPQNGAFKGEGVSEVAAAFSGGMGSAINGGGGGNNHNNGGGGGANLNPGGDGGGNSSTGFLNCRLSFQGKKGRALSSHGGRKIFMGGGGGAGQVNNGFAVSNGGGHGGGIAFIRATTLIGNGRKISANGQVGGAAASDGASGGGAGGTIIMDVVNYTGAVTIEANGGQGGTENDGGNINYCYGAGGGGSGGTVYLSGAIPASPVVVNTNAGAAGPEIGRDASCQPIVPSGAGTVGDTIVNYAYRASSNFSGGYCSILLPVEFISFNGRYASPQAILDWKVAHPELVDHFTLERSNGNGWTAIRSKDANDNVREYDAIDGSPAPGYNIYRIKLVKKNNAVVYSTARKIYVPTKHDLINVYPNPADKKIMITGISSSPSLSIFDLSGKQVWQKRVPANQSSVEVDLPALPSGVYVLKVDDTVKRLVIK